MRNRLSPTWAMNQPVHRTRSGTVLAWFVAAWAALIMGVMQLPAQWACTVLNQVTQGRVMLLQARGTVWHGSAFLALGAGSGGGPAVAWPQRIQWRLAPSAFNEISLNLATAQNQALTPWDWQLRWMPSGWQISAGTVDWRFPSPWLAGLGTPWNTIEPTGQVHISSTGWRWQHIGHAWQSQGRFTLTLLNFATQLSSLKPLGDYQVVIDASPQTRVDLKTLQGPLQLSGHGIWHDGKLQFEGEAWALHAQDEPVLSNLLGVLGTRNGARAILKVG